jgi:hypothetical protein
VTTRAKPSLKGFCGEILWLDDELSRSVHVSPSTIFVDRFESPQTVSIPSKDGRVSNAPNRFIEPVTGLPERRQAPAHAPKAVTKRSEARGCEGRSWVTRPAMKENTGQSPTFAESAKMGHPRGGTRVRCRQQITDTAVSIPCSAFASDSDPLCGWILQMPRQHSNFTIC